MIRRSHLVLLAFVAACTSNPVGRVCDLGSGATENSEIVIASPSLDCVSRTCLSVPLQTSLPDGSMYPPPGNGLCTAQCQQDSDCDRVPESPCVTGFTCGVAVSVGPFCCEKFCICKDYIVVPDSGSLVGSACDADIAGNACCNLPGRTGNADYPLCKS